MPWTALPRRRLRSPHDFDLLAVCLSLRRDSLRSPLLHEAAPARGLKGTSGPQRESGGVPHIQSTQTDMVAPQETIPEDPETGPKPGNHLSKVSIHLGKVLSITSSKPVPQPQMFKSAPVGRTDEKDFQSSPEERKACGTDGRVMQKLPNSIYVSKMDLGHLAPTGSSVPHLPPTLLKKVQVEAEERGPQMAAFLPCCPRSSGIPGVADLRLSPLRAWPADRRTLVQKLRSSGLPPLLHPGHPPLALGDHRGMTKIVSSALACAGSGSPSSSETALLASTCPQVSRIPGLPSVERVSRSDQSVWDRCSLWRKPSEPEEPFAFGSLMKDHTVAHTNMVKIMVAMLPTCPRGARIPGFPSACPSKAFSLPSMAGLLPTCPTQMTVAGMPFRAKVVLSFDRWNILRKHMIHKPPRRNSVLVDEYLCPFCPWKAVGSPKERRFVSLPLTPHQSVSMVDFVPACPRRSRVLGLPSKEFISYQNKNVDTSLMEEGWNRGGDLVGGIPDSDNREISPMVAMLPSCPERTCILGMPSRSHKVLSHTGQVSVCCIEAQRPDAGSQIVSKARDYRTFSRRTKRPEETTQVVIQPLTWKDSETLTDMVDISSSCPKKATVFGLPSVPRQDACMVDLLPSCPGCTQICGLPSKETQTPGSCKVWFASTKTPRGSPFIRRGVQLHDTGSSLDESTSQAMTATRPCCPLVACVPGLPSALTLTDGPKMVNSSHGFTGDSRVSGMSLGPHTKQIKWTMERKTLLLPQERSRFHLPEVFYHHDDVTTMSRPGGLPSVQKPDHSQTGLGTVMVSMLPSCPNHSNVTGIPSKESSYFLGVHLARTADMQVCCPKTGCVLGLHSKHVHCSGQGWPGGDSLRGTLGTEVYGKDRGEFMKQHLSLMTWEDRCHQTPILEGSADVRQTNASSACPLKTSVQVGQACPGLTFTEISRKEESAGKKTCFPAETLKTEAGFWTSREKEDAAAMGCG